jgi:hypothetical protein
VLARFEELPLLDRAELTHLTSSDHTTFYMRQ